MHLFQIKNFSVSLEHKQVLRCIDLTMLSGSVHVLMGPNGSGKSTLALALMGHQAYVTSGTITVAGKAIEHEPTYKRAQAGLFLSFQHPYEIPGVPLGAFLKAAYEAVHGSIDIQLLRQRVHAYLELLRLDQSFYYRNVHEGFSGGEKKKLEVLQLLLLRPKVAVLDELDSGLDVDALRVVAQALQVARVENPGLAILCITHYQRILAYLQPDFVHLLMHGSLIKSGDHSLALDVEKYGYDKVSS